MKISKIKKEIKGVFKQPVRRYYFGKLRHGCPYFYPWYYCSTIFMKKKQFTRCKSFKLFGQEIAYGWPIKFVSYDLGWKDKFDSPRYEWSPCTQIVFFGLQWCMWHVAPIEDDDRYWEMVCRYLFYDDKDIKKAEENWGWTEVSTKKSTWNKDALIQK